MEIDQIELDRYRNGWVSFIVIIVALVIYLLSSFAGAASDNIGVFIIPIAALCFYAPLICLIASFVQAKNYKRLMTFEEQASISTWKLTRTGMPNLFWVTGFFGLLSIVIFPISLGFYLLAPVWVVYGLFAF